MCDFISRNKNLFEELDKFIDTVKNEKNKLIITLHHAQKIFGYIPQDVQIYISEKLNTTYDEIHRLINFYDYFSTKLNGKYKINVCIGSACGRNDSKTILCEFEKILGIKSGETTKDLKFSLSSSRCIGACRKPPIVSINGRVYEDVTLDSIPSILQKYN